MQGPVVELGRGYGRARVSQPGADAQVGEVSAIVEAQHNPVHFGLDRDFDALANQLRRRPRPHRNATDEIEFRPGYLAYSQPPDETKPAQYQGWVLCPAARRSSSSLRDASQTASAVDA